MDKKRSFVRLSLSSARPFPTFLYRRLPPPQTKTKAKAARGTRGTRGGGDAPCEDQVRGPQTVTKQRHKAGWKGEELGAGVGKETITSAGASRAPRRLNRPQTPSGKPPARPGVGNSRCRLRRTRSGSKPSPQPPFASTFGCAGRRATSRGLRRTSGPGGA